MCMCEMFMCLFWPLVVPISSDSLWLGSRLRGRSVTRISAKGSRKGVLSQKGFAEGSQKGSYKVF